MLGKIAFVTGGTGFVGSHLVDELLARGVKEVRCLVRTQLKWLKGKPVTVVRGDLDNREALEAGCRDAHYVLHVGGLTRARGLDAYRHANVEGTRNILRAAEAYGSTIEHVLLTSSLAAIGASKTDVATEDTPLNPISAYGISKAEMEHAAMDWARSFPISIVRPPAVYGPRDTDVLLFFKALDSRLCVLPRTPTAGQDFSLVHVADLVRGMADCLSRSDGMETYFLGSERYYAWTDVRDAAAMWYKRRIVTVRVPTWFLWTAGAAVDAVGSLSGRSQILGREKVREILEACKMCSVDKAREGIGYRQNISLADGIRDTLVWYRKHGWLKKNLAPAEAVGIEPN